MKDIEVLGKKISVKDMVGDLHEGTVVAWGDRGIAIKQKGRKKLRHFLWMGIVWFDLDPNEKEDGEKERVERAV